MEQMKILVVDDEQDLCDILLFNLRASGYVAEAVYSAEQAMEKNLASYDLLLLDVMMPGLSGFELAERLKTDDTTARIPIIFLTAKDTEDDALHGFGIGADDYVTKPFSVREVMARVKAVLSRSTSSPKSQPMNLVYEGLSVDLIKKTASVDGNVVELTKTELELLCLFLSHRGQVFSRQELIEKVWPQNVVVTSRTIDVNISVVMRLVSSPDKGMAICLKHEKDQ